VKYKLNNFKDFTSEDPVLTPIENSSEIAALGKDVFSGFDFFNTDYNIFRHHGIRPSQQQPMNIPAN